MSKNITVGKVNEVAKTADGIGALLLSKIQIRDLNPRNRGEVDVPTLAKNIEGQGLLLPASSSMGGDPMDTDFLPEVALLSFNLNSQIRCAKYHCAMSRKRKPVFDHVARKLTKVVEDMVVGIDGVYGFDDVHYREAIHKFEQYTSKIGLSIRSDAYNAYVWRERGRSVVRASASLFSKFRKSVMKTETGSDADNITWECNSSMLWEYWAVLLNRKIDCFKVEEHRCVRKAYAKLRKQGLNEYAAAQKAWEQKRAA